MFWCVWNGRFEVHVFQLTPWCPQNSEIILEDRFELTRTPVIREKLFQCYFEKVEITIWRNVNVKVCSSWTCEWLTFEPSNWTEFMWDDENNLFSIFPLLSTPPLSSFPFRPPRSLSYCFSSLLLCLPLHSSSLSSLSSALLPFPLSPFFCLLSTHTSLSSLSPFLFPVSSLFLSLLSLLLCLLLLLSLPCPFAFSSLSSLLSLPFPLSPLSLSRLISLSLILLFPFSPLPGPSFIHLLQASLSCFVSTYWPALSVCDLTSSDWAVFFQAGRDSPRSSHVYLGSFKPFDADDPRTSSQELMLRWFSSKQGPCQRDPIHDYSNLGCRIRPNSFLSEQFLDQKVACPSICLPEQLVVVCELCPC